MPRSVGDVSPRIRRAESRCGGATGEAAVGRRGLAYDLAKHVIGTDRVVELVAAGTVADNQVVVEQHVYPVSGLVVGAAVALGTVASAFRGGASLVRCG